MKKFSLAILLLVCCSVALTACDSDEPSRSLHKAMATYTYHTVTAPVTDADGEESEYTLEYRLLEPVADWEPYAMPEGGYPLVIFLAGNNEAYTIDRLLIHGADYFIKWQAEYPCYVAFPRCAEGCYWTYPLRPTPFTPGQIQWPERPSIMYDALKALVEKLRATYPVNPDRVVVAGFSMGAFGALDMAARAPLMFAAVQANAGGLNIRRAEALKDMDVWLEHCEEDNTLPCEMTRALADELARIKGDEAASTLSVHIYPGGSHISFHCFDSPELMEWIYSVRRHK